jgi:hypothetical protein
MNLNLAVAAVLSAAAAMLLLGVAGAIHGLWRVTHDMPAPADAQAVQDAPARYIGRAIVPQHADTIAYLRDEAPDWWVRAVVEHLAGLPTVEPGQIDPVDQAAADAIHTLDLNPEETS